MVALSRFARRVEAVFFIGHSALNSLPLDLDPSYLQHQRAHCMQGRATRLRGRHHSGFGICVGRQGFDHISWTRILHICNINKPFACKEPAARRGRHPDFGLCVGRKGSN